MSLSDRRSFLALMAALPAAACGFTPAYGPHGAARALLGRVRADDPTDKDGFDFAASIEDRLGPVADGAAYALGYRITVTAIGVAITPQNVTTRYNLTGQIAYTLKDTTGKVLTEGSVNDFTSYSATGSTVSTLAAQTDARTRLMRILADQVVTRLIASAGALPK